MNNAQPSLPLEYPEAAKLMEKRDKALRRGNFAVARAAQRKLMMERARELDAECPPKPKKRRRVKRGRRG